MRLCVPAFILAIAVAVAPPARAAMTDDRYLGEGEGGTLRFAHAGEAVLAGIVPGPAAAAWLHARQGQAAVVRVLGTDRYGRARLAVRDSRQRGSADWQELLLRDGSALLYDRVAAPPRWRAAEAAACHAQRGWWRQVQAPSAAEEADGRFILVRGTVTRSYKNRRVYYINFGANWQTDFSLRIPRRSWRGFGADFTVADGATITARGTVMRDNGPMIEITRPEQLTLGRCAENPVTTRRKGAS